MTQCDVSLKQANGLMYTYNVFLNILHYDVVWCISMWNDVVLCNRRKFRSQTSDNMEAEMGRVREEKSRREKIREEKESEERRWRWFVAPEGRKVGSLKRRVRSHLARWEMKNCTPLWCEAHLQVKKLKTPHVRTTLGSWDVEKVHAVVARSTFQSQNVQNTPDSDHF